MINGHGNNIYQFGAKKIEIDFSSNIAFNNRSESIYSYLKGVIDTIGDYPDPEARELTSALARHISVAESQLLITNGSAEAFYLIAHYLQRRSGGGVDKCRTAITVPSFAEYEDSCRIYGHEIDFITFEQLHHGDIAHYQSIWLGLPNNPDGERFDYSRVRQLAATHPNCSFIVDRAYNELSQEQEREWELLPNIIIVDSFTKVYGVPGIRLGYIVASEAIVEHLSSIRPPWSVNSLSQLAGQYILDHYDELQLDIDELLGESKYLQQEIAKIDGFRVTPSTCNFFLVEITGGGSSCELQQYLVENHGILIRDCSNFRSLSTRHIRIAAQPREACCRLINALKSWR